MGGFRINADRLWSTITETARFGATGRGGLCRLALSDADRQVRDWFREACEDAGCRVHVDAVGNMFARRAGRRAGVDPIAAGSHLDTQPTGGRFDGIVGVLAGLEVVRTLNDRGAQTEHPIEIVNWTNEEGARFRSMLLGSGVFAGVYSPEFAYDQRDREGHRFGDELERIGYCGTAPCGRRRFASFFELHIEQGPVLEERGKTIGVVIGVQGMRWFEVDFTGMAAHAGTTPRAMRHDASVGAARFIETAFALADSFGEAVRATTGVVEIRPGAPNVVPESARLTLDLRHPSKQTLDAMEEALRAALEEISVGLGLRHEFVRVSSTPPVAFDAGCIQTVREAAETTGFDYLETVSGAGHDAVHVSRVAPTAMIFIPCASGVSHNERESASPEHVAAGAEVLLESVLRRDRRLASA
ncbi:MAG: Zn-dependent hydrolase [Gammaproteobacteria bacterium]|nr:Zn-dependent hydrolase [Gammaproteobacteria bacterium]NIR85600.1 Zn-dependent hydrolase [Gammaproteobacteria bacterium]NIR90041.1 Zn-dependent hydrolase [Gammaproteobacteria bacterium]NIU06729.1 Zn-dependent hydrolase [Gammaproteobacteria bacterium]NIV53660.1 hydantoinase/carbamoylase family amidase [Gammaproteobacteria bacterium]